MSRSPSCPNWYDQNAHLQERRKMITNIARLLQARKPNAPVEWMQKLPQMARRLEESLFRSAHSFDEYKDTATLKKRLQALAMAMGLRAQQQQAQQQAATADGAAAAAAAPGNTFAPIAPPPVQAGGGDAAAGAPTPATAHAPDVPGAPPAKRLVSLSEINPLLSPSPLPAAVEAETASPMPGAGVAFEAPPRPELAAEAAPAQNGHAAPAAAGGAAAHAAAAAASQRPYHADQRQQVLRQQQQRLLLLRHASKCPHDGGSCPVTPHCNGMKRLWKHIAECKDQQCQVAHCVSSRYVLSHYHRCKDARCAVCGPVREAIQRNHEKAKQVALQQHASNGGAPSAAPSARVVADPRAAQHASAAATQPQRAPSQRGAPPPPQQPPGRRGLAAGGRDAHGHESKKMRPSEDARPAEARAVAPGRIEEGTSLLNSFSPSQIHAHLQSLKQGLRLSAVKIRAKCGPVLKRLLDHDCAWIFLQPVDAVELNLPDYFEIVKHPMDLGSIKKRLDNAFYKTVAEFAHDVRLTFDNAVLYNGDGSDVAKVARDMRGQFDALHEGMLAGIADDEEDRKASGDVCVLCGCEKLLFEATVYYCNGACHGQRIRRNSYYYTGGRNQYHWCQQCHSELRDKDALEFADCTLYKKELTKKKNDEMHEEPWVECSQCKRWVHQICALFNGRMNKGTTIYHCPFCFMAARGGREPHPKPLGAKDIRHTKLSSYLEARVEKALADHYAIIESTEDRPMTLAEKAPAVFVRQLSNLDKVHSSKPRMLRRYASKGYAREFSVRSKCVLLFQEMDGVDVILFGMYLYEYGHGSAPPNQRRVYVSYLDSVYYFQPRRLRTLVYHEMLIAYLANIKQRGFHTAHIWACPPCKGDDYIFFCHPEDQKTPKDDRLRAWYLTLLEKAKDEGIVTHITNLWDEHFRGQSSPAQPDATSVPYFEGDYWPGEAENVIKALEDEEVERSNASARKSVAATKSKAKGAGRGARQTRSDGLALDGIQDGLLQRMSKILEPMKDAFIVAYLMPRGVVALTEARSIRERLNVAAKVENAPTEAVGDDAPEAFAMAGTDGVKTAAADGGKAADGVKAVENKDGVDNVSKTAENGAVPSGKRGDFSAPADAAPKDQRDAAADTAPPLQEAAQEAANIDPTRANEAAKDVKVEAAEASCPIPTLHLPFDETLDTDEIIESEFYDTRQQFLNLCQGNHYQFDELRRAKHTSMMALYHLHNPDVPKFLVTCSHCNSDVNGGYVYNSEKDAEFHLCQDCYSKAHKAYAHKFPLRRSAVGGDSQAQLTEEQRRDRQRSIQLHMQLLQHAAACRSAACPSANCTKMKNLLKHGAACTTRVQGGCAICRRIWALLQIHARQCRREACAVPKCRPLREQLRALAQQQAQMDERRRAAMNAAYSTKRAPGE